MEPIKIIIDESSPWGKPFIQKIKDSRHYRTIKQWEKDINIAISDTVYYKELIDLIESGKPLWNGIISTKLELIDLINNFKDMYINYDEKLDSKEIIYDEKVDWYYGDYPAMIKNDGSFELYDANHRTAIRLIKGLPVTLTICNVDKEWTKLLSDLNKMYGGNKSLYQPIPHPSFNDWTSGYDQQLTDNIVEFVKDHDIISALDVGCCHAYNLYKINESLVLGTAIEYDETRYKIVSALTDKLNLSSFGGNVVDYLKASGQEYDCVLATAIFHHIAKQSSKEDFDFCLTELGKRCKYLLYTLPVNDEFQYDWIKEYPNLDDYIAEKTGKKVLKKIKLKVRELTILQ